MEVAGLPLVAAVDRGRNHRDVLLDRDHRGARLHRPGNACQLARALDEETERATLPNDLAHPPDRFAVGLATADRDRAEAPDQLSETGDPMRLDLRDEMHRPRRQQAEHRRVDPVEVVDRQHHPAGHRDALRPVGAHRRHQPHERPDREAADRPDSVDAVHVRRRGDEVFDQRDHLVDLELARVDLDRVLGRAHVDGVLLVAQPQVGRERVGADPRPLGRSACCPDPRVGEKVNLYLSLRCDNGADVTSLDDDVADLAKGALPLAHHLAHLVMASDHRHELVDVGLADRGGDVAPADEHPPRLVEGDRVLDRELGELVGEIEREATAAREPGERAVHRPRVEVAEAQPLGEQPCDRALTGPCGPIDGDDHEKGAPRSESRRS